MRCKDCQLLVPGGTNPRYCSGLSDHNKQHDCEGAIYGTPHYLNQAPPAPKHKGGHDHA